jgi:FkbH-like protein
VKVDQLTEIIKQIDPSSLLSVEAGISKARAAIPDDLPTSRVYFLNNFTISTIEPFVQLYGLKSKLNIQVGTGDYNVIHQALMTQTSSLHQFNPNLVVLALRYDILSRSIKSDICTTLKEIFDLARSKTTGTLLVNTFLLSRSTGSSDMAAIQTANEFIRKYVSDNPSKFHLCDWNHYLQRVGYKGAIDRRYQYMAKAPFKPAFLSQYAAEIAKVVRSKLGLNKKCIVLDCDGTMWGGVLGEDGLESIALHADEYPGNVYHEVQRQLLDLHKKGVLLAINSKNNEADVFEAFEKHPYCLLKKEHFSAYRINWKNKADNILSLAKELNLGLDSFVFLDDSDFECEMVRARVPAVEVRQVPKKLYTYPDLVADTLDEFFHNGRQTKEDAARAGLYAARHKAEVAKAEYDDLETYLHSLNIKVDTHKVRHEEVPRVAQLTQKTNQFNMNKTVYTEAEIHQFIEDKTTNVFVMVVRDRFGELGLTNICIVKQLDTDYPVIDTFLMSCRVFERQLEYTFLDWIIADLTKGDPRTCIRSIVRPSLKNIVAQNFYHNVGFKLINEKNGTRLYELNIPEYTPNTYDYIQQM